MHWLELAISVFTLILGVYYWSTSTFDFWKSRGVSGPRPLLFWGNIKDVLRRKKSFYSFTKIIYDDNKDQSTVGIFLMREPALLIIDLELIKDVLVRDFTVFPDRGWKFFNKVEPLSQNLINLDVARWRPLRPKLSPIFATSKWKRIFSVLIEYGDEFNVHLDNLVAANDVVDCHELTAKLMTDIVGHYFWSVRMNAIADEKSIYRKIGKNAFLPDWKKFVQFRLRQFMPWLYNLVGPLMRKLTDDDLFMKIAIDMMDHRKRNNIVKDDFIDLLMNLREHPERIPDCELTDAFITAQLYVFFLAGFETSAVAMSHVLYELAQNHHIQDRVRDEINNALAKTDGKLTYEALNSIKYLDMVLKEAMRKYPPVALLQRTSAKDYTFANGVSIPKGTKVMIPVFAIHRDPRLYPKPEVFDPERFTDEAVKSRHLMTDLSFGQGPRICIARRYANYQSKFGLLKILQRYRVEVCEKTQIPFIVEPTNIVLSMKNTYVKFIKINKA